MRGVAASLTLRLSPGLRFKLQNGRHPLQEVIVSAFVPNDTALAPGDSPGGVAIISGANFSGKSVYLKQVGAWLALLS